jgi:choline kinase
MADGKGLRWGYYNNMPKHLIKINEETLLERTVRLIKVNDLSGKIIITSHDPRYEVAGAIRHEPKNNILEIDRFTQELIEDNTCFLYGDTYYSEKAMNKIFTAKTKDILFFGTKEKIIAIKIANAHLFKEHVDRVKALYLNRKIKNCIGWQVYQSFVHLPFDKKIIADKYILIDDETCDFNSPEELEDKMIFLENNTEIG